MVFYNLIYRSNYKINMEISYIGEKGPEGPVGQERDQESIHTKGNFCFCLGRKIRNFLGIIRKITSNSASSLLGHITI